MKTLMTKLALVAVATIATHGAQAAPDPTRWALISDGVKGRQVYAPRAEIMTPDNINDLYPLSPNRKAMMAQVLVYNTKIEKTTPTILLVELGDCSDFGGSYKYADGIVGQRRTDWSYWTGWTTVNWVKGANTVSENEGGFMCELIKAHQLEKPTPRKPTAKEHGL